MLEPSKGGEMLVRTGIAALIAGAALGAHAQQAVFETKSLTPEAALTAARAALESCRKAGYQVSVAVVDRSGLPQVLLRDRYATAHTVDIALDKAWTAASFKIPTAALAAETQSGRPMSGLRSHARVMAAGGGQVIEAAGSVLGAIAVSGAAGGDADDACSRAGIKAIADGLEF
jgi:uncharacterized protein GlcG (DUF336 family)